MRGKENGRAPGLKFQNEIPDFIHDDRVKSGIWFIKNKEVGLTDGGHTESDFLHRAFGESFYSSVKMLVESQLINQSRDPLRSFAAAQPGASGREKQHLFDRQKRIKAGRLLEIANFRIGCRQRIRFFWYIDDLTGLRFEQIQDNSQSRGFTRTVRAKETGQLISRDRKIHSLQCFFAFSAKESFLIGLFQTTHTESQKLAVFRTGSHLKVIFSGHGLKNHIRQKNKQGR